MSVITGWGDPNKMVREFVNGGLSLINRLQGKGRERETVEDFGGREDTVREDLGRGEESGEGEEGRGGEERGLMVGL